MGQPTEKVRKEKKTKKREKQKDVMSGRGYAPSPQIDPCRNYKDDA